MKRRWKVALAVGAAICAALVLAAVYLVGVTVGRVSPASSGTTPGAISPSFTLPTSASPATSPSTSPATTATARPATPTPSAPSPTLGAASPTPCAPPACWPSSDPAGPSGVAQALFPDHTSCHDSAGQYTHCPVDASFLAELDQSPKHMPGVEQLCRCLGAGSSDYDSPTYTRDDSLVPVGYQGNASWAAVDVRLHLGPSGFEHMVVVVTIVKGRWLADDTYCDNPQNRYSAAEPQPCAHTPS